MKRRWRSVRRVGMILSGLLVLGDAGGAVPAPGLVPRPGARLPLEAPFTDETGRTVRLAAYFDGRPVLLLLGYYRCPNLCDTLLSQSLQAVALAGLRHAGMRVLAVSIDPAEDAALAAGRKAAFADLAQGVQLDLLTGSTPSITRLTQASGFRYRYDSGQRQYLHPAVFIVATGDGVVSAYLPGVGLAPAELRAALAAAGRGSGADSLAQRIVLLCSRFDPVFGRYSGLAMNLVRGACLLAAALLAVWLWRLCRARQS